MDPPQSLQYLQSPTFILPSFLTKYNIRKLNLLSKTDISKTAWINTWHEAIIVKLNCHGSSLLAVKLISYYLAIPRTRTNNSHSYWEDILFRVLNPSLFNIFLSDSFLVIEDMDFASYANDNLMCCWVEVTSLILPFFYCKILLRKFFIKMKPYSVKQPKKKKRWQMLFTFEQKLRNLSRSSFFFHQK